MIIFLATSFLYAKDRFVPAIQVDDMVITQYEIDQRTAFFDLLNFPGDHKNLAKKSLIDDRLKKRASEKLGVKIKPEALNYEMKIFANR